MFVYMHFNFSFFVVNFYSQLILCFVQLFWSTFCLFSLCIFQLKIRHNTYTNGKTKSISIHLYHHHMFSPPSQLIKTQLHHHTTTKSISIQEEKERDKQSHPFAPTKHHHHHIPSPVHLIITKSTTTMTTVCKLIQNPHYHHQTQTQIKTNHTITTIALIPKSKPILPSPQPHSPPNLIGLMQIYIYIYI